MTGPKLGVRDALQALRVWEGGQQHWGPLFGAAVPVAAPQDQHELLGSPGRPRPAVGACAELPVKASWACFDQGASVGLHGGVGGG